MAEKHHHEGFYLGLRKKVGKWHEKKGHKYKWADYLLLAPDLFYTLVMLMADKDVPAANKIEIVGAIAYFVSPVDLVPELILGPIGYIDDMALAALVLNDIINSISPKVVARHWPGDDDVLETTRVVIDLAAKLFGKERNREKSEACPGGRRSQGGRRRCRRGRQRQVASVRENQQHEEWRRFRRKRRAVRSGCGHRGVRGMDDRRRRCVGACSGTAQTNRIPGKS